MLCFFVPLSGVLAQRIVDFADVSIALCPSEDALAMWEKQILSATRSVDIGMFYISHTRLMNALAKVVAKRNVRVRVLADSSMASVAQQGILEWLQQRNIEVYWCDGGRKGKMHLKCAVIDGDRVLTGTANWTEQAFNSNGEICFLFQSPELAGRYTGLLDSLISSAEQYLESSFSSAKSMKESNVAAPVGKMRAFGCPPQLTVSKATDIEQYFTLIEGEETRIVATIKAATNRVDMGMYLISEPSIIDALCEQAGKGISVRLLVDKTMLDGGYLRIIERLARGGVKIYYFGNPRASLHLKLMVVDARHVWAGSANYTRSAFENNVEDVFGMTSPEMAVHLLQYLDGLQSQSEQYIAVIPQVNGAAMPALVRTNYDLPNMLPYFGKIKVIAQTEYLADEAYYTRLLQLIRQSQQSVFVLMYAMTRTKSDQPYLDGLVKALAVAASRGVHVYVVLHTPLSKEDRLGDDHSWWVQAMRKKGIDARLAEPRTRLHEKMVVVDLDKVIIGSHNWTEGALSGKRVMESSAFLKLAKPDKRLADYVFSRPVIEDTSSPEAWEREINILRQLISVPRTEKKLILEALGGDSAEPN